jgi:hypothetical protein
MYNETSINMHAGLFESITKKLQSIYANEISFPHFTKNKSNYGEQQMHDINIDSSSPA